MEPDACRRRSRGLRGDELHDPSPSRLLRRAIDLIDPPRTSPGHRCQSGDDVEEGERAGETSGAGGESPAAGSEPPAQTAEKRVRFGESHAPPPRSVSVGGALRAYDLLIAASAALSSSVPHRADGEDDTRSTVRCATTSWETLRCMADTYRALHVTSCLLRELLRRDEDDILSPRPSNAPTLATQPTVASDLSRALSPSSIEDGTGIPKFSRVIENTLLSTSRRCILLLKALEKVCAAKATSQRHEGSLRDSLPSMSRHEGGDDIRDHDRSISDLYADYDWHDDGHLPPPLSSDRKNIDDKTQTASKQSKNGVCEMNNVQRPNRPRNILQECCVRPHFGTDPPSSKLEKNAWTRDWIRGERIVSLELEDYPHCSNQDDYIQGGEEDSSFHSETALCKVAAKQREDDDCSIQENGGGSHGSGIIDISSEALAEEEELFLDIVCPGEKTSPGRPPGCSNHKRSPGNNAKERRKKKRQRNKLRQRLAKQAHASSETATSQECDQSVHTREGFLLLARDNNTGRLGVHDESDSSGQISGIERPIRVFARLRPFGLLSVEDCSIRTRDRSHKNDEMQEPQTLLPRLRYFDFLIGSNTKCVPYIPENALPYFHFRLDCICPLGASSLCQSLDNGGNTRNNVTGNMSSKNGDDNSPLSFIFGIDEETGCTFADGFEWITALSGAANAATLLEESIHSEWSEHSVDPEVEQASGVKRALGI